MFALDALDRWRRRQTGPFDVRHASACNAFLHGALAPDMGYFPGGDAILSRMTHTSRTGGIARELLAHAATEEQRAFVWGWITHILLDTSIHPLVNAGAATLFEHVRIEVGIDLWYFERVPHLRRRRLRAAFDRGGLDFLTDALRRLYRLPLDSHQLFANHCNVTRFYNLYLLLATILVGRAAGIKARLTAAIRWIIDRVAPATPAQAFVHPERPDQALINAVEHALRSSWLELQHHAATGLREMSDVDLETGEPVRQTGLEDQPSRAMIAFA
jgi:hypothetical protein